MLPLPSRRSFLISGLGLPFAAAGMGCGTILHPERRGQPAGKLDWKIVALDGLGLLFFFIPGVIAFAADFSNGTIYLPCEECTSSKTTRRKLREVRLPKDEMSQRAIEEIVAKHAGREVRLEPNRYATRELRSIDEFWETRNSFADS